MNEEQPEQLRNESEEELANNAPEQEHGDEEHERADDRDAEEDRWPHPRIYVASLSDYNAGRLHGEWVDAAQSAEELRTAISEMLAASPEPIAEEWAIHDAEGFGPLRLGEYESIEHVAAAARGIAEHGPAYAAWAAQVGIDETEELERFEECFLGRWDSVEAYAEQYVDDTGIDEAIEQAAGSLAPYVHVDTEALGRDMVLGGYLSAVDDPDGGVFLFGQ